MKDKLRNLIGALPSDNNFKKRMRFHQGWWRAFVLAEEEGKRPTKKDEVVCSTILNGQVSEKNFLSPKIIKAVRRTIEERKEVNAGILEEDRLFNNLLSSQPLCFNFFGELKIDTGLALQVLRQFWPELTEVQRVLFEFAPKENYTNDNSAFDVAFEVMTNSQNGLIGLECKYTDTFSKTEYDKPEYRDIFDKGSGKVFLAEYDSFKSAKFNQLFRNQLMAQSLVQNDCYQFVYTGLFCHQDDEDATQTGGKFQQMLKEGSSAFKVITYRDFIKTLQSLEITWEQRELSMLLWARYCATQLSDCALK